MHAIETRYPDGTRARYTLAPGSTVPLQLAALKPARKPRPKAEKRLFPAYTPDMSTKDYIRAYFARNVRRHGGVSAYDDAIDHLALFAPLPDSPAAYYTGVDSVETIDEVSV